jgi:hypothetical protein
VSTPGEVDLSAILDGLPTPKARYGGLAFSIAPNATIAPAKLGKSIEGEPAILFPATELATHRPPVELRHLSVLFGARCHVSGDLEAESFFTVVRCHGDDALRRYFLIMARGLLSALGPRADDADVEKTVRAFVELFRAATRPPVHALRGLWGELLVIARCMEPATALRAWHLVADERFDFGSGMQRLEVKTASRSSREHHFSLDQLTASDVVACVASIQVEPSVAGRTLLDLVDEISGRLSDANDTIRLQTTVGAVLGTEWTEYSSARFDDALATSSLQFFRAESVPRVSVPLPSGVRSVEFVADLATSRPMTDEDMARAGGLWSAARPAPPPAHPV